jgi:hypothetical protein
MTLTLLMLDVEVLPRILRRRSAVPVDLSPGTMTAHGSIRLDSGYPFDDILCLRESASRRGDSCSYTDGLSEAARGPDPERDMLGAGPLADIFQDVCIRGAGTIAQSVFARVDQFRSGWPPADDATALIVTVR